MPSRVIVDTSVWSQALRRRAGALVPAQRALILHWADLVRDNLAVLIGPVRQEILTGVREDAGFERLREHLRGFDDEPITTDDYARAARFANVCFRAGVAGSPIDFIICAVAGVRDLPVMTTDPDFARYAAHVPVRLYQIPRRGRRG